MDWTALGRWEWLLVEVVVLGLAVAELISVRRSLARDRKAKRGRDAQPRPVSSDPPAS